MPYRTPEIEINPKTLEWARTTAGFSYDDIARYLDISSAEVIAWEKSTQPIYLRVSQLENLSSYLKRPLAAFLLSEPPIEPKLPQDFRRPHHQTVPLSSSLRFAIRRARRLQRIAREMLEEMDISPFSDIPKTSLQHKPEVVAKEQREIFNISVTEQFRWRDQWQAFRKWRDVLEKYKLLTFQSDFPREEAQGFSLSENHPYVIIVSSEDPPTARCFTLFHELGHLLLRQGGICLTDLDFPHISDASAKIENWCHRFAESFLIDEDALRERHEVSAIVREEDNYLQSLENLAHIFKVSQAVVLFRIWHIQLISEDRFWYEYNNYLKTMQEKKKAKKEEGKEGRGPSPSTKTVQERGRFLTRTILEALDRQILNYTEVADYLGVRLQHLDKVRQIAYG